MKIVPRWATCYECVLEEFFELEIAGRRFTKYLQLDFRPIGRNKVIELKSSCNQGQKDRSVDSRLGEGEEPDER